MDLLSVLHKILMLWRINVQGSFNLFCVCLGGVCRQENIKNTNRSSSKTSIKLTLAFYNLQHVEQRRQKIKPTPHKGSFFSSLLQLRNRIVV